MSDFQYVAAFFIAVIATARVARLATWDKFPPAEWVRGQWSRITGGNGYELLFYCGYCFGFWVAVANGAWAYLSDFHTAWWWVNAVLAVSYLSPTYMSFDGDDGD